VASVGTPSQAEIALYRVLGVRDDYLSSRSGREADHELIFEASPRDDDTTRIVIGGRPEEYISAWRQAWALIIASMKYSSTWKDADDVVQPSPRKPIRGGLRTLEAKNAGSSHT